MIAAGYTLDLYCDAVQWDAPPHGYDEFPHQFYGETFAGTSKEARKMGWKIMRREGRAICPKCNVKPRKTPPCDRREP